LVDLRATRLCYNETATLDSTVGLGHALRQSLPRQVECQLNHGGTVMASSDQEGTP
jgi:hypothetical protein